MFSKVPSPKVERGYRGEEVTLKSAAPSIIRRELVELVSVQLLAVLNNDLQSLADRSLGIAFPQLRKLRFFGGCHNGEVQAL